MVRGSRRPHRGPITTSHGPVDEAGGDHLLADIVTSLDRDGHYLALVWRADRERLEEVRATARLAGRRLGRRVHTVQHEVSVSSRGLVAVMVLSERHQIGHSRHSVRNRSGTYPDIGFHAFFGLRTGRTFRS